MPELGHRPPPGSSVTSLMVFSFVDHLEDSLWTLTNLYKLAQQGRGFDRN
ncbi:hypothetical protein HanIR_Chr15g0779591 [Helianthus annuus]|nr:hypothetical protein HanIR_Chr15g0779591 [Helianthus annuus]